MIEVVGTFAAYSHLLILYFPSLPKMFFFLFFLLLFGKINIFSSWAQNENDGGGAKTSLFQYF